MERERARLDERCTSLVGETPTRAWYVRFGEEEVETGSDQGYDSAGGIELQMRSGRAIGLTWDDALVEFGMNVCEGGLPVGDETARTEVTSTTRWASCIGSAITSARIIWKRQEPDEVAIYPQSIALDFASGGHLLASASDLDYDWTWGADHVNVFFDRGIAERADLTGSIHEDDVARPVPILRRLMGHEFISTEQDGAVAVVTIENPPMNQLSAPLLEELEAELDRLDGDGAVRAIVLVGAGERAFVAGADIKEFPSLRAAATEAQESGSARGIQKLGQRMDAARTPFVASIHGFCLGGGLELAMCCDIRVCSDDAQLGQPEIKLGLIPGGGGTQRLPRLVGIGRAQYLNMTGEFIDAQTAYDWGLVEKVVPREELREAALGVARTIAGQSPVAVGILRELARTTRDLPLEEGLRREADGFRRCLESEDGAEGVAAFIEKRQPNFVGR